MKLIPKMRLYFVVVAAIVILLIAVYYSVIYITGENKELARIIYLFLFSSCIVLAALFFSSLLVSLIIKSSVIKPLKIFGDSFNKIMINFENIKNKTVSLNEEINKSNYSTNDVKFFFTDVMNLITSQAAAITESSASIEEMSSSINNVAKISEDKISMVNELKRVAYSGENKMEETIGIIKKVSDSMIEMKNAMSELAVGSNEIMGSLEILLKTTDKVKKNFGEMNNKISNITTKLDDLSSISTETKDEILEVETAIKDFFSSFNSITKNVL